MSESQFQTTAMLCFLLHRFKEEMSIIKTLVENYDPDVSTHRIEIFHLRILSAYQKSIEDLIASTKRALDYQVHPDTAPNVASLVLEIEECLSDMTIAIHHKGDGTLAAEILKRPNDEERKEIEENRGLKTMIENWRDCLFDLPFLLGDGCETPPDPFEDEGAEVPREFKYEPLPTSSSIRIVEMRPEFESNDDTLCVSMKTMDLEDKPEYTTLSYTWGNPTLVFPSKDERDAPYDARGPILCNGCLLYIGQNLYRFMRQWRENLRRCEQDKDKEDTPEIMTILTPPDLLWIDAICINQTDEEEKNRQVAMMGRIYKMCNRVIVWLGDYDCYTGPADRILEHLYTNHSVCDEVIKADDWNTLSPQEMLRRLQLPNEWSWVWVCVWALFNRSWFRRTWVIQEVALAPEVHVQIGHLAMTWGYMLYAADFLRVSGIRKIIEESVEREMHGPACRLVKPTEDNKFITREEKMSDSWRKVWFVEKYGLAALNLFPALVNQVRGSSYRTSKFSNLVALFETGRNFECRDPRDKVYAFLALSQRDEYRSEHEDPRRKPLEVRYQDSVCKVYLEAAWYILLSGNHLHVLSQADTWAYKHLDRNKQNTYLDLPSWAPDWTMLPRSGFNLQKQGAQSGWNACNNLPWEPPKDTLLYQPYLSVSAGFVDVICEAASSIELSAVEIALGLPPQYQWKKDPQSPIEVLWRTLFFDIAKKEMPVPSHFGTLFEFHLIRTLSGKSCWSCAARDIQCSPEENTDDGVRTRVATAYLRVEEFLSCEAKEMTCRDVNPAQMAEVEKKIMGTRWIPPFGKVFRTEKGYLGMGLPGVQPGDEVHVVAGSTVPLVLRRRERQGEGGVEQFALVSEAYVHGMMFGEVFEEGREQVAMKGLQIS